MNRQDARAMVKRLTSAGYAFAPFPEDVPRTPDTQDAYEMGQGWRLIAVSKGTAEKPRATLADIASFDPKVDKLVHLQ